MVLALRADSICPNSILSNLSSLAPKTILSGTKLGRVSDPYGGRARDGADQNEPKERAPRDLVPAGLPFVLQAAWGSPTARPCAGAERAHPLRAPSGSLLAAFQYSAASNGLLRQPSLLPCARRDFRGNGFGYFCRNKSTPLAGAGTRF